MHVTTNILNQHSEGNFLPLFWEGVEGPRLIFKKEKEKENMHRRESQTNVF